VVTLRARGRLRPRGRSENATTAIHSANAFYGGFVTAAGWMQIDVASALATPSPRSRASASPTTAREFFTQ
jgi:hypothetical protein